MLVIEAGMEHLETLVGLFDAYRVFYEKASDRDAAKAFLSDRISNRESVIFLVLDESGAGIGFTQLYPLFSSTRMARLWLLNDLYVEPQFRGKGVSKLLIRRAQDFARSTNAAGIMLETAKSNEIGNGLYPANGFSLDTDFNVYHWNNPDFKAISR